MSFVLIALGIGAAILSWGTYLFPIALVVAVIAFWSNGVLANFTQSPQEAPDLAALASMVCAAASVVLCIWAIVLRIVPSGIPDGAVAWDDADKHVGENVQVCGPVKGTITNSGDTFINVGRNYPDQDRFTIVVWNADQGVAGRSGDTVCIRGQIQRYEGTAQITTTDPSDITVE